MENIIIQFLKHHLGNKPAILGLSGGVDSAVVAFLLTKAIHKKNVYAYILPSAITSKQDINDAKQVAKILGIKFKIIKIDNLLKQYLKTVPNIKQHALTKANLQARIRMTILYSQANLLGGLVVGTGNKSELDTGYFTKYGDGGVDLLPIGHLYKTQIWELAKQLGVPAQIINKAPTAGLKPKQTDEQDLGMKYEELDKILIALETNKSLAEFKNSNVLRVKKLYKNAQHKLKLPPKPTGLKPGVFDANPRVYPGGLRALFIGRFQPFHLGHLSVLNEIEQAGFAEVIIGIGSSQYAKQPDNPFSFNERENMIKQVLQITNYKLPYTIIAIPDINDDASWVRHVNKLVQAAAGEYEAVFTGNDWVKDLFEKANGAVRPVHKIIMIDGTAIRNMIREGDIAWKQFVHESIQEQISTGLENVVFNI
ncbi:MAG: NAD+ synthase [Patescibacteria group bacterium]|jgi:NAD+ synthase